MKMQDVQEGMKVHHIHFDFGITGDVTGVDHIGGMVSVKWGPGGAKHPTEVPHEHLEQNDPA